LSCFWSPWGTLSPSSELSRVLSILFPCSTYTYQIILSLSAPSSSVVLKVRFPDKHCRA
jgi:hypothetical protein